MPCNPKCLKTASLDNAGHRIMVSVAGNKKYPTAHTTHPQCSDCIVEELEEAKLAVLFNNDQNLIERWQKLKDKNRLILNGSSK